MCWLPTDQPLLLPSDSSASSGVRGPSPCSVAQLLAARLRRIGDQLEKDWVVAAGGAEAGAEGEDSCGGARGSVVVVEAVTVTRARGHWKRLVRAVIRVTVHVLFAARRHL